MRLRLVCLAFALLCGCSHGGGSSSALPGLEATAPLEASAAAPLAARVQSAPAAALLAAQAQVAELPDAPLASGAYRRLYSFRGGKAGDGGTPNGDLAELGGDLYGTTEYGGNLGIGCGTIFRISTSGVERTIHSFAGGSPYNDPTSDGCNPIGGVITVDGKIYGTTVIGGNAEGSGTFYSLTTSGSEHLYPGFVRFFAGPVSVPVVVAGNVYGPLGGANPHSYGSIYGFTPSGAAVKGWNFSGSPDGAYPQNVIGVNGALYATTYGGDSANDGTIFKLNTSGSGHILYKFKGGANGTGPRYLVYAAGALYVTTGGGNAAGDGLVVEVSLSGQARVVYRFKGGSDGSSPNGLILVNGALYGTTSAGGASGHGTVYKLSTSGVKTILYSFKSGADGQSPSGNLTSYNGKLYGTTQAGGTLGKGTVFSLSL